jgi:hypothetical protein
MIISKILGGLGNQMFCYAAGRAVALRNGVELKLDIRSYPDCDQRIFELHRYQIAATVATETELLAADRRSLHKPVNRALKKLRFWQSYGQTPHFRQRGFAYDPEIHKVGPSAYLEGLFQCEQFFQGADDTLRKEFTPKESLDSANAEMAARILSGNSVSLHVRRTDYVNDPKYRHLVSPCSLEYYQAAIELMQNRLKDFQVFVFSDEPEWCQKNLRIEAPCTIVNLNGTDKPWLDMHLMSKCRHHVLANSTYSWWGAWLANNDDQLVVAPKKWFASDIHDDSHIVPERWIKL